MHQLSWLFDLANRQLVARNYLPSGQDDVETWLAKFIQYYGIDVIEVNQGADRVQVTFSWQEQRFLLYYESLCDALWIENYYPQSHDQLADLYSYLLERKDNN